MPYSESVGLGYSNGYNVVASFAVGLTNREITELYASIIAYFAGIVHIQNHQQKCEKPYILYNYMLILVKTSKNNRNIIFWIKTETFRPKSHFFDVLEKVRKKSGKACVLPLFFMIFEQKYYFPRISALTSRLSCLMTAAAQVSISSEVRVRSDAPT